MMFCGMKKKIGQTPRKKELKTNQEPSQKNEVVCFVGLCNKLLFSWGMNTEAVA